MADPIHLFPRRIARKLMAPSRAIFYPLRPMDDAPASDLLVVEDRGWPLLVVRFPHAITDVTMRAFIEAIERAYARKERFAVVIDTGLVAKFPTAPARQILTDWIADERRAERERLYTVATAVALASGPLRALTAAINLMRRPVSPQHWTKTVYEAVEWSRLRLIDAGVTWTAGADALYAKMATPRARRSQPPA